jgi:uncharacterized membrane protein
MHFECLLESSSSKLHGLGKSPVMLYVTGTSSCTFFVVFLCLVYQKDGIRKHVVGFQSVPSFADVFSICIYIVIFSYERGIPTHHFVYPHFLADHRNFKVNVA